LYSSPTVETVREKIMTKQHGDIWRPEMTGRQLSAIRNAALLMRREASELERAAAIRDDLQAWKLRRQAENCRADAVELESLLPHFSPTAA
jgi:hypothetical protein